MFQPICFMVMPFGKKATGSPAPGAPAIVDFDVLWRDALKPALQTLGYEPVRADQDTSALIIQEMLERLAASDLIVADMSIPNANVYYEVGFRHGLRESGCVLIAAEWSKPLFDVQQMRRIAYPLPSESISNDEAKVIQDRLIEQLPNYANAQGPAYQCIPGFPIVKAENLSSFRDYVQKLSDFQASANTVRRLPDKERAAAAAVVVDSFKGSKSTAVILELLFLIRDTIGFPAAISFIDGLSPVMQAAPVVREQRYLAVAKSGKPAEAIAALEELIRVSGSTPEREGLLGGRFKQLYRDNHDAADLDRAIEHYERGMTLDLNQYYCSSNLPRLLRTRNEDGDEDRARATAHAVLLACERARSIGGGDEWLNPTLLGSAFDAGDLTAIAGLTKKIRAEGHAAWKLTTTIRDIQSTIPLHPDTGLQHELESALAKIEALLPAT